MTTFGISDRGSKSIIVGRLDDTVGIPQDGLLFHPAKILILWDDSTYVDEGTITFRDAIAAIKKDGTLVHDVGPTTFEVDGHFDGETITLDDAALREVGMANFFILKELTARAVNYVNSLPIKERGWRRREFGWK